MNVNQNILIKNRPFRFQLLGMQRTVQITIEFKIQGILKSKPVNIHSSSITFSVLKNNVQKLQREHIANRIPIDRVAKFIKNGRQFIPFSRLQEKDEHQLLAKEHIYVEYLYKNKRDQFQRKIVNLQSRASEQHELLKQIVQEEARTKADMLKRLASNDLGLQAQNALEVKIRIVLYISDPLVYDKQTPTSNEELNVEDHVNILELASNLSQSLSISIERAYAFCDSGKINVHSVLDKSQKSRINIVHFFVNVVKDGDEVMLILEGRNHLFGKAVPFNAKEFFQQVKNSSISLLIFIGANVDLLKQIIPSDLQFSTLLLTTYSPNKQEGFKSLIRVFYEHLFNRYQLNESVDIAIKQYKRLYLNTITCKKNYGCCCVHQHKDNCAWTKIVELIGKSLGHKIFFHNDFKTGSTSETKLKILKFQSKILEYFSIQAQQCGNGADFCCQPSHKIKQSVQMNKKIPFYPKSMSPIFQSSQNSQKFKNNAFHVKFLSKKTFQSYQSRRCPLRIFQIVSKILQDKNKIIQIIGSRRIGKGQFIEASCKYITNREESYCFEDVDENQSTLKECLHKIFIRAQILKQQKQKKNIVFIHHNKGMMIEKQNIKQFYQNSKGRLPFTFLVKLNSAYEQKSPSSLSNHPCTITLPKLNKLEIFCQIFHEIRHKTFYQEQEILSQVFDFCNRYNGKITFKEIRTFLQKQYKDDKISWLQPGRTLTDKWKLFGDQFTKKVETLQSKNKKLYDFLGFLSLFSQGFYLTKLTEHLLQQILDIPHLQGLIKTKEIAGLYFEIYNKPIRVRKISTKVQRNDFIIPNDKIINFFRARNLKKYHQIKLDFFHDFFNLMEGLIFKYEHILRKMQKRQRPFLEEGIFMFNYWKGENQLESTSLEMTQKSQIISKRMRRIWKEYQSKIDWKFWQESYESKNPGNVIISASEKERFLQEKTLELILHESERFVLCRHICAIAELISTYPDKNNSERQQGEMEQNHKEKKCPIVFYRKIIFVCKILLKEPIKYELIETKLKQLQPKFLLFLQEKGVQYLQRQTHHRRHRMTEPSLSKQYHSLHETNSLIRQKDLFFNKYQHGISFKSYLSKVINYLQMKIILSRRQKFSLSFGDSERKRRSFNEFSKRSEVNQKLSYLKDLQRILPKVENCAKSEPDIHNVVQSFSYSMHKRLLLAKHQNNGFHDQYTTEDFMLMIINELMIYESEQNFINYFYDEEPVLDTICNQIQAFKNILQILGWISSKRKRQHEKSWFFKLLTEEEINMQILRLCMRKIEVHFKLKKSEKDSSKERIKRNIDIKNSKDLKESSQFLRKSHIYIASYHKQERIDQFLQNAEICTKYIELICENDKITEEFTTSIGQVDTEYKEIFSYLCEQTWKKTLFNGENNIIFFKSKPIVVNKKPYTYVRKRSVTMKYMIKILREFKINITFLHLTKNNFNYIQRDKNNPNCKIKYFVLTVDTVLQQKDQLVLLFQDEKNITHQSVKIDQFLGMMNKVVVDFIIVMGRNAILLAEKLSISLHNNPIVIGIQSPIYNLANFVKYTESKVIDERDEIQPNRSHNGASQHNFVNQIYEYMNLESYHCMLDMIVCSLITDMVNLPYKKSSRSRSSQQTCSQVLCTKNQIIEFLKKSRGIAKKIMAVKWPKAQQISIQFEVFTQENTNLRRNYSSISSIETTQSLPLNQRMSSRDSSQSIKYVPFFQKGSIIDNTTKIYESQLESQDYYENVNRNQHLYTIIKFIQQPGRRIVQIFGSKGAGKTSFLKQICWMNIIYKTFKDGVFIIDVDNLSRSSQTILQNIEIVYKQSKMFSLIQDIDIYSKNEHATILLALDNMGLNAIRQNSDFFERIRGKPICVLYSTNETNLKSELEKYFRIQHHEHEKHRSSRMQEDDIIIHQHNNTSLTKQKSSSDKRSSGHCSHSMELQSKKSIQHSESTSDSLQKQEWSYLQIDINILNKNALFNIALSYLKKQEFKTLKKGMYEFIRDYFAGFVEQAIEEVSSQNSLQSSHSLSMMSTRRNSEQNLTLHLQGSMELQRRNSEGGSLDFRRICSSVQSSEPQSNFSFKQANNFQSHSSSNLPKLLKLMNEYFRNLTVQKVVTLGEPSLENDEQVQMIPLIQRLDENIVNEKKDTRLWFYEDCFEELTKQIVAYDFLQVAFR